MIRKWQSWDYNSGYRVRTLGTYAANLLGRFGITRREWNRKDDFHGVMLVFQSQRNFCPQCIVMNEACGSGNTFEPLIMMIQRLQCNFIFWINVVFFFFCNLTSGWKMNWPINIISSILKTRKLESRPGILPLVQVSYSYNSVYVYNKHQP